MTTAVFAPSYAGGKKTESTFFLFAKSIAKALTESRMKSAGRALRRHEALVQDLGRRQDHSPLFLEQSDLLPFRI